MRLLQRENFIPNISAMSMCAVLGCTSKYGSNQEKHHRFRVPKNPELQKLWEQAVEPSGVKITCKQSVCEKHFTSDEILWQRTLLAPNGMVLGISPYNVPRLKEGSVPSIFPWTKIVEPQWQTLPDGSLLKAQEPVDQIVIQNKNVDITVTKYHENCKVEQDSEQQIIQSATIQHLNNFAEAAVITHTASYFVKAENSTVVLPSLTLKELGSSDISMIPGWTKQTMTCGDMTIEYFSLSKCITIGTDLKTFPQLEVIVKPDMTFQISILGQPLRTTELDIDVSPICTIQRFHDLMFRLNSFNICIGTKPSNLHSESINSTITKDFSGTWRHIKCFLLLSTTSICPFCRRARKIATAQNQRLKRSKDIVKTLISHYCQKKRGRLQSC